MHTPIPRQRVRSILFHYDVVRQVVCEGMNDAGSDIDDEDAAGEAFGIAGQGR